jgi:hypothetical protein
MKQKKFQDGFAFFVSCWPVIHIWTSQKVVWQLQGMVTSNLKKKKPGKWPTFQRFNEADKFSPI